MATVAQPTALTRFHEFSMPRRKRLLVVEDNPADLSARISRRTPQVFLNLIGNAIQAMPSGGTLRLRVAEAADLETQRRGIAISVTDTGGGIRREDAKRLFQPFFTTKSAKGTGLGLWISKGIIQKYEGTIGFRSFHSRAGACTCFRVFLPLAGEMAGGETAKDADVSSRAPVRAIA
jgi:signal transduction histidine kinase